MTNKVFVPKDLLDKLKKLHGLPPYQGPNNYCYLDGYFAASITEDYPKEQIEAAKKQLGVKL